MASLVFRNVHKIFPRAWRVACREQVKMFSRELQTLR